MEKMNVSCSKCGNNFPITVDKPFNFVCSCCGSNEIVFHHPVNLECSSCGTMISPSVGSPTQCIDFCTIRGCKIFIPKTGTKPIPAEKVLEIKQKIEPNDSVSVVVVCHNALSITRKCIEHLRNSEIPVDEIVLVDNGSSDGTKEWAKKQNDLVYVQNRSNLGCGIGRNQGVKWATGTYILFLDNDQFIALNAMEAYLEKAKTKDLVGVETWQVSMDGTTSPNNSRVMHSNSYVGGGGLFIRKDVFERLGGFDERYFPAWYEDVDFSFKARKHMLSIGWISSDLIEHLSGQTHNIQNTFNSEQEKGRSKSLFLETWFPSKTIITHGAALRIKPRILIVVDVEGWAWDNKTKQIIKHLKDDYDFSVIYRKSPHDVVAEREFDIFFTFDCPYIGLFSNVPREKLITGVTAHTFTKFSSFENLLKRAVAVHANSKMLYDAVSNFHDEVFYTPNGVDENLFKYKTRDIRRAFTAGYVGKNTQLKGYDFIRKVCEEAEVLFLPQVGNYKSSNMIPHKEMPKLYEKMDVVVIASEMDGTPNQLLEAGAVGRPAVGNSIGNVPEFIEHGVNGFLLEKDFQIYVDTLKWLKNHRKECREMGKQARETVKQNWTWKIQSENYRNLFEFVLSQQ